MWVAAWQTWVAAWAVVQVEWGMAEGIEELLGRSWRKTLLQKQGYLRLLLSCERTIHQNPHVWMWTMEVQQCTCCLKLHQKNPCNDLTFSSDEQAGSGMALVGEVVEGSQYSTVLCCQTWMLLEMALFAFCCVAAQLHRQILQLVVVSHFALYCSRLSQEIQSETESSDRRVCNSRQDNLYHPKCQ